MGKRSTTGTKRAAAVAQQGRPSRPKQTVQARKTPPRRPIAIGIILLLLAVGALLAWQIHGRAQATPIAGAGPGGAADEREAALLQAVQAHPSQSQTHRELADYYLGHQRPFEALWELAMVHDLGLVDVALTLDTAGALKRAGLPQAALRVLSAAHEDFHGEPSLDRELAVTELEVADPRAAMQVIQSNSVLRAGPDGLLLLARAHLALNDLPLARTDWRSARQAVAREPSSKRAERSLALGRLALALEDFPAAREELAAAAQENPHDEETQYYAGLAFAGTGTAAGTEKAIAAFKQATRDDPHQARAGVELGRLLYEKSGQWQQAADVYRRALSMDARCLAAEEGLARARTALKQPAEAVYHQARLCELKDRPDEALRLYRRWGELQPERWDSVLRAAECWMDMGRYLDAAHEVQRGLERYPNNPELFSHLAQLYLRTDSRPEAARLCDRWALVDSTSGRPEWVRGQLAEKAIRIDDAVRWYEAAVRKDPEFGTYHAALGAAVSSQPTPERLRRARAELEQATVLDPPMASFQSQLGLVLQQMEDLEGARRAFLRALDRDSDRLDAYAGLMEVARRLGQPRVTAFLAGLERDVRDRQRVETAARQDLSVHPRDARSQEALAQALLRRGQLAETCNHLEIAAEQPDGAAARPLLRRVERP